MREAAFLKRNKDRWERFEALLSKNSDAGPDELDNLYIQLTDDLAYARTYYPNSATTQYINNIAIKAHNKLYRSKKLKPDRIRRLFMQEIPLIAYDFRKDLLISLLIFSLSVIIGALSVHYDDSFTRIIMGDAYVNMTESNIEKGDPMAVYKSMNEPDMFIMILLNNINVCVQMFIRGLLFMVGTGFYLVFNGIMLGSFQQFFIEKGLFWTSFRTIWIHGTIEILSIVASGGAGLALGRSWMYPGTYKRFDAFKINAKKSLKLLIPMVPLLIIAAFLESFVTRKTEMPDLLAAVIIGGSLLFMIWYYAILPARVHKQAFNNPIHGNTAD